MFIEQTNQHHIFIVRRVRYGAMDAIQIQSLSLAYVILSFYFENNLLKPIINYAELFLRI